MNFIEDIKKSLNLSGVCEPKFRAILIGDEAVYFENICSIKSYSQNKIELLLKKNQIKIEGENLFIKKYCQGDLLICGKIQTLSTI